MNAHRLPLTLCRQNESANSQKPRKSAEQMGEIQKPNKTAEQISEVGRNRPLISGGGGGGGLELCTHPMPLVLPKVINFGWAHTQCLQFCQKQ